MRFIKDNVLYDTKKSTLLGTVDRLYEEYSPVYGWDQVWRPTDIYLSSNNHYFTLHKDRHDKWILDVVTYQEIELILERNGITHIHSKEVIKLEDIDCRFKYNGLIYDTNYAQIVYYGPVTHLDKRGYYHVRPTWVFVADDGRYFYVFRKGGKFKGKIFKCDN